MAAKKITARQSNVAVSAILSGRSWADDVEAHAAISDEEFSQLVEKFNEWAEALTPAQRQVIRDILESAAGS